MVLFLPLPASALEGNGRDPFPDFVDVGKVAKMLNMHPESIWRLIEQGILPSVKERGVWLIPLVVAQMFTTNYNPRPGHKSSPFLI